MTRAPILLALLLAASAPAAGAEGPLSRTVEPPAPAPAPLTLDQAFRRALAANPAVGIAVAGVEAADQDRRQVLSAIFPRLALTGRLTRNSEEAAFGDGNDQRVILPEDDWSYRLTLSQPIYAGNRERRAYEQAKLRLDTARRSLDAAREGLLLAVAEEFLGVVEGDALIAVERQGVELAAALLEQAKSFYSAGEVTEVEIRRAEAGLAGARRRETAAHQRRETAASRLRLLLALDRADAGAAGDDARLTVKPPDPASFAAPLPTEAALVTVALERRSDVLAARNDLASAALEVRKQRGAYLPVVTFDASYLEQKSPFPADAYGSASINLSLPLFNSGETAAKVRAASQREVQARLALEATEQLLREEIRRALLDLDTAETSLTLAREQEVAAAAEHAETFALYQAQESTALEVRQAESSLAEARRALIESSLERDLARARVWHAAGSLGGTVLGTSPTSPANASEDAP